MDPDGRGAEPSAPARAVTLPQRGEPAYLPFSERPPSVQYRDVLSDIMQSGEWVGTRQNIRALTAMQQTMRFDLQYGFPVVTERDVRRFWRTPIDELCAFINGVTTSAGLSEFGVHWWEPWTTEAKTAPKGLKTGEIGPGSYGGAFRYFPTGDGGSFDQFQHLIEQICELPGDRTHFVSPWIPQYQARGKGKTPRTTIAPCHGWVHVRVMGGRVHLHMFQRSGDVPVGVPSNMIQYAALLLMVAHLTGFTPGTYYHTISDAHIYENQLPFVEEMLAREPRPLPTVTLNDDGRAVADIHDFRGHHFDLADYEPHGALRLPPAAV